MRDDQFEFYLYMYPDLVKAGITTREQAEHHYNKHGRKEGRLLEFNTRFYKKFYGLTANENAWLHYKNTGRSKGYQIMDDKFYVEDLTLREIMRRREIKFKNIQNLLKDSPISVDEEGRYNYIKQEDKNLYNIKQTQNVSSNPYHEVTDRLSKDSGKIIVDVGSGKRHKYYVNVVNVEIVKYHTTDVICMNENLPFKDNSVDYVLSMCVLEHVKYPWLSAKELKRILKPGGQVICNIPFLQPYHGYPGHYFNATYDGMKVLMEGLKEVELICPIYNHPIFTLTWFIHEWLGGLTNENKEKFKKLTIGEIINKIPTEHLKEAHCNLSKESQNVIACGFYGVFEKPDNI